MRKNRYIPLGRVSSQEQKRNTSVDSQLSGIDSAVPLLLPEAEKLKAFTDIASARSADRPGLQAAYRFAKYRSLTAYPATHLLVYTWDRWFRNRDLSAEWRNKFKAIGVEVNAVTEWVNYNDPGEIIVHAVREAMAEGESMKISERTTRGMKARMKLGYWIFDVHKGYKKSQVLTAHGTRSIVVDPEPARQKARAMSFIAGGLSQKAAWRQCGGSEVLGSYNAFCDSLLSPFDLGIIDYTFPDGERIQVPGQHPAIVDKGLQDAVRKVLRKKRANPKTVRQTDRLARNPARQVINCPNCGKPMTTSTPKSRGVLHEYYSCYRSAKRGACGKFNLRREHLHPYLKDLLLSVELGPEAIKGLEQRANQRFAKAALQRDLTRAVKDNDEMQRRATNALTMRMDGEIEREDLERIKGMAATTQDKVDDARRNLDGFSEMRGRISSAFDNIGEIIAAGLEDDADKELSIKTHHFLQVLCPDGLTFYPENGTFGITKFNQILCGTGLLSVSYAGIETGLPPLLGENPEKGRRPGTIRTLATDKDLVEAYLKRYA